MNQQTALLRKLEAVLPAIRTWIEETLAAHRAAATPVSSLGFERLAQCFPADFLDQAKAVAVTRCPAPPLSRLGLPELSSFEHMPMDGITFNDTFFVQVQQRTDKLHFHELVHVAQWNRLGVDNFLRAYGVGLVQFAYKNSPLEQMAYQLQSQFERSALPPNVLESINAHTDLIWSSVVPVLLAAGIDVRTMARTVKTA